MIALLLKERSSRSQDAGYSPSSPGTLRQMMADDALHVCSDLLTVSVSPIPLIHENQCPFSRALYRNGKVVNFEQTGALWRLIVIMAVPEESRFVVSVMVSLLPRQIEKRG
jgi:hypothetical protein